MINGLKSEITQVLFYLIGTLIIGFAIGYPVSTLLCACFIYLYGTYRKASDLLKWLQSDNKQPPSELNGFWAELAQIIYKDKRKIHKIQLKHVQALVRVNSISKAMRDGIVILNENKNLDWWNNSAELMLKLKSEDRHSPVTNRLRHPLLNNFLSEGDFSKTIEYSAPGHSQKVYEVSASTFGANDKEIVLVFKDISNLIRLERMRKDFVANISHELRTPLTVINGYVDNLEVLLDEQRWRKIIHHMRSQSNRITALADDLTMLSKLESDNYQHKKETVDINSLLDNIVDDAKQLMSKEHTLLLEDNPKHLSIEGNYPQLYSAISNLVVNAIRHNPTGCDVLVKTKVHAESINIIVSDNGKGIASKHIPRLTERFYRTDSDRNSSTGGTGLGLAIVKHVLQHHDGQLEISSREGEGADFSVKLLLTNK